MDDRLLAADAALKAGKASEAIDLMSTVLTEDPAQTLQVYRVLSLKLYEAKRYDEAAEWAGKTVARFPKEFELWNLYGVILRRARRYDDAIKALDQAQKLNPKSNAPLINKGNIYNDLGNGPASEAVFSKLVRLDPRNAEYQRGLGRALINQKRYDQAAVRCRQAVTLKKDYVDAWMDWSGMECERLNFDVAVDIAERAIAAAPGERRLLEAKASILRRMGLAQATEDFLTSLLPTYGDEAWLQHALGASISDRDRARANDHLGRAVALEPDNLEYRMAMVESLERSRHGDEGANIEAGYKLLQETIALRLGEPTPKYNKVSNEVLIRVCAFEELDALGSFRDLGRGWAESGRHTALLKHLARVQNDEDRYELLEQHRIWGDAAQVLAARTPVKKAKARREGGKIRLGFMSSDLRSHPVGYFAYPLFEYLDDKRFEVFCYSFYQGQEDAVQKYIGSRVAGYRWNPDISGFAAAQMIADDDLDMLIELGGSTHMNKLEVMAYRPARLQASWLGYPHSAGLSAIDYIVLDPNLVPEDPKLLIETPMVMPKTWLALGRRAFSENYKINEGLPQDAAGCITFGTANNPHKYSEAVLRAWARVVAAVPGSRFQFVRPEGGSETFRKNIERYFAAEGVSADRIVHRVVRGLHMAYYNEIDITLDPFPLTGGTTTCEALWMGVPVVNLRGKALFERLSGSILTNLGLAHHIADNLDDFVKIAVDLAADRDQRLALRHSLRERMRASPLGQNEQFARDFYDLVASTVESRLGVRETA
ncbi:tetratricopeptide repeat protein [Phenylobacterium sp.]|uniref:O-linked N-acetylglucosamine transferase, SPINDLY family protein n=1 Tax=Phenylobacterium sp. TaxID=1871053 RepID=UPI0027355264|nr:tetratricopeptide repeat protein [Phenylobacterium sp.]MDP3659959.1 tetratricopeptide repeat protein [Phenylobacterium sp.]